MKTLSPRARLIFGVVTGFAFGLLFGLIMMYKEGGEFQWSTLYILGPLFGFSMWFLATLMSARMNKRE